MPADTELILEPGRTERNYWSDLWRYRELFFFFAWRDTLVRYKQAAIGVVWAVIKPLLNMLVLTYVFGNLAKMPSGDTPYAIIVLSALLPWQFFSAAFASAGQSLVSSAGMISKVYFPRLIVPASAVAAALVDFFVSFLLLLGLMAWYRHMPSSHIVALPLFALMAFAASLGVGVWIAALNVKYRDFTHVIPFMAQIGVYLSPVGYLSSVVPAKWRLLYSLNPMVSVIDGFRWAIVGDNTQLYAPGFLVSTVVIVVILGTGVRYFRRTESTFADIV